MAQYSSVVSDHFHHSRRVGPLEGATHKGVAGVPGEGPYVELWLRVDGEQIHQAAYRTWGCPAAVASASILAELVEGKKLGAARQISESDIVAALEGLPEGKEHCPRLAIRALRAALATSV